MSKNKRRKHSGLKKSHNTKARRHVIEADYVDGVYNSKGERVIRPLTEEEKDWLNKFYEETVVTNFLHGKGMKEKNKEIKSLLHCEEYKKLSQEQKEATTKQEKERFKELKKLIKEQNMDDYGEEIEELREELQDLRDQHLLYPDPEDHKIFFTENNHRNNDVLNKARLEEFKPEIMDKLQAEVLKDLDYEEYLIDLIEGEDEDG